MSLNGCATERPCPVRVETRDVPVEVFKPLPDQITAPLVYPQQLRAGYTVQDVIELTFALYDLIDRANADRAAAAAMSTPK